MNVLVDFYASFFSKKALEFPNAQGTIVYNKSLQKTMLHTLEDYNRYCKSQYEALRGVTLSDYPVLYEGLRQTPKPRKRWNAEKQIWENES